MPHYHTRKRDKNLKAKAKALLQKRKKKSLSDHFCRFLFRSNKMTCRLNSILHALNPSNYWSILNLTSITVLCILMASPIILVPQHDAIKNPAYWYEALIASLFSFALSSTFYTMMECKILFDLDCFTSIKTFLTVYGTLIVSMLLLVLLYFAVFVLYLHYDPPMPLVAIIGYLCYYISLIGAWFSVPHAKRTNPHIWKQYKVYVAHTLLCSLILKIVNDFYVMMLKKTSSDFQWIVCLGLPILREILMWLDRKLLYLAFTEKVSSVSTFVSWNIGYALTLAVQLGTFTTETSGFVILTVDFAMNIWNAIKISKLYNKVNARSVSMKSTMRERQYAVSELALTEIIEFIVPVTYIASLLVALNGPNSSILGNYGNGYWTFRPVENVNRYVVTAIEMFAFDCCSFIVGGFILWKFCAINFLLETSRQIQKHWPWITICLVTKLNNVSTNYIMNATLEFLR